MKFTAKSSLAVSAAMLLMVLAGLGTSPAVPLQGGQCDFTVAGSPASATITSGQSAGFRVDLQNLGLEGRMINVLIRSVSPQTKYEPTFHQPAYDIWLPAKNGTGARADLRKRERQDRENDVYDHGESSRCHQWVRLWCHPRCYVRADRNIVIVGEMKVVVFGASLKPAASQSSRGLSPQPVVSKKSNGC